MIERISLLIGLPGSGKTTLAAKLAEGQADTLVLDDPMVPDQLRSALLQEGCRHLVVCDVNLCDETIRSGARVLLTRACPDAVVEEIFFENDVAACRANIGRRDDGRNVEGTLQRFAPIYTPPHGADIRPVYRPEIKV